MLKRIVSGILFVMLLAGMLTLAFDIQPVKAESKTWTVDYDEPAGFSEIRAAITEVDLAYAARASRKHWSMPTIESFFENGLDTRLMDVFQLPFEASDKWDFGNKVTWDDFAYVDDDSAELVIGLSDTRPNSYSELVDLIMSYGGELVNSVSMDGMIEAVVADISLVVMSNFVSEVEIVGLSRYIEPNMRFEVDFVPNDPGWSKQWGPRIIEADKAWNTTIGDSSILVAVIDTGIDWNHPDLAANYVPLGYDWVNNDSDPMDDYGHGTHCAGIIGAVINNSIGIAGLAQVGIMAEKGFDQHGSGSADDLANAIVHAVDQGADILSNSWGSFGESALIYEAVKYAHDYGVLVVAAAGNDASECKQSPARYEEVVAVTATDSYDYPASFTNFGDWVEVAAPGVEIYSTIWDDSYSKMSGTSMSTPHVSGLAALFWSQFPNMSRDQVRAQLRFAADDLGDLGFDEYYGYGRINARRVVEQALPDHDLDLLWWKAPSIVKPFDMVTVNVTLLNFGANNESDIIVRFLVNGSVADSVFVNHLASGESTTMCYTWSPTVEGKYNITVYVTSVQGEILTENNILFRWVIVRLLDVIVVPDDFPTIQKAVNEVGWGYTIQVKPGTYYEHVIIEKSVTLIGEDCQTTIIDGYGIASALWLLGGNANVTGFTIQNGNYGIFIYYSYNNGISGNMIANNQYGIFIYCSSDNTFRNNNITCNQCNFYLWGVLFSDYINDVDTSNTIDGKPIYYLVNRRDVVVLDAGYVAIVNCTSITIQNSNLTNNWQGIVLAFTTNSTITGNNITNNSCGIDLWNSDNCTIIKNIITKCFDGILLERCNNNTIQDNDIMLIECILQGGLKRWGITLYVSGNNTIFDNEITETHTAIYLFASSCNNVADNTIANNGIGNRYDYSGNNTIIANLMAENQLGIYFPVSSDNIIYHNDFINNEIQVQSEYSNNMWDDGYPSGGNYWSDYIGEDIKSGSNQNLPESDGIGDTPYTIDMDNRDHYPLWYPWSLPSAEHDLVVFLEAPTIIPPGYPSLLSAIVVNKGLDNETSVELKLMIDGDVVNSTIIQFLQVGSSQTINHQWTSTIEGIYNVTAYALPVPGEESTANNIVVKTISVFAGTNMYVNPLESTVLLGETFTVDINVAAVEDLYGWQVTLYFDPAVLNCTSARLPSDHVFADADPFVINVSLINNTGGYVTAVASLLGDIPEFTGSGILCEIEFRAIGLGTSDLTFSRPYGEDTFLVNHDVQVIPDVTLIDAVVEVIPAYLPVANFTWTPSIPKVGESVTFNASASKPNGGTIINYKWNFGDGGTATGKIVTHFYASLGTYTVTLNVTDSEGFWDIEQKQIQVVQPHGPKAEFTATPEKARSGETIKFDASASLPGWNGTYEMLIVEYRWDFGDGNKTTTSTPTVYHSFSSSGIYYITLTVHAPGATPETDTISRKVTIISVPVGGYSLPIKGSTTTKSLTLYLALITILTTVFTIIKNKAHKRTKHPRTP